MPRQATVTEAARLLGVSRRTIERRLKTGILVAEYNGNRRLVTIPDELVSVPMARMAQDSDAQSATVTDKDVQIAWLQAELVAVKSERDNLRQLVMTQAATLARVAETKAIEAPKEQSRRPWWAFWRREG